MLNTKGILMLWCQIALLLVWLLNLLISASHVAGGRPAMKPGEAGMGWVLAVAAIWFCLLYFAGAFSLVLK